MGVAQSSGKEEGAAAGPGEWNDWIGQLVSAQGSGQERMRIAASADLHFTPQSYARLKDQFEHVRDDADVLVLAGDLTNYGQPEEMEPLLNVLVRLRLPTVVVLGNHDYESGKEEELRKMLIGGGV